MAPQNGPNDYVSIIGATYRHDVKLPVLELISGQWALDHATDHKHD